RQLPGDKIYNALDELIKGLSTSLRAGSMAAKAVMTTDTIKKEAGCKIKIGRQTITIGGMAKGSGMIAPDMATMLSFITTDIRISPALLKKAGYQALEESFNNITVDGDMSTNDTVLIMANGLAGNKGFTYNSAEYKKFCAGLTFVCIQLAKMIVADGEGAAKLVDITVKNSRSRQEARRVALGIANSNLVKTMIAGGDPNWGRVISAAGAGKVKFDPERVKLYFGKYCVFQKGQGKATAGLKSVEKELSKKEVKITLDLNSGKAQAKVYTCDLTKEYVAINAEYST
ncbi:MAG: bifunctional glutamate N-acetyltransferase/amino-acid acetyltransferase ArgJ, partial [Candidatus Omnitrophica bacterium]|nr:bifunctional glutamate N-acetyltransferase/amino-acid acetyltransferase ArgJ [Candidatus Omnitrophota bacterium]